MTLEWRRVGRTNGQWSSVDGALVGSQAVEFRARVTDKGGVWLGAHDASGAGPRLEIAAAGFGPVGSAGDFAPDSTTTDAQGYLYWTNSGKGYLNWLPGSWDATARAYLDYNFHRIADSGESTSPVLTFHVKN